LTCALTRVFSKSRSALGLTYTFEQFSDFLKLLQVPDPSLIPPMNLETGTKKET